MRVPRLSWADLNEAAPVRRRQRRVLQSRNIVRRGRGLL